MIYLLHRKTADRERSGGTLFVGRSAFATLEAPVGESWKLWSNRLPDGQYELELVDDDLEINRAYRTRFGSDMHHGMVHLVGTDTNIAMGNRVEDAGYNILVGMSAAGSLLNDTQLAYETVYGILREDIESGAQVMLDLETDR